MNELHPCLVTDAGTELGLRALRPRHLGFGWGVVLFATLTPRSREPDSPDRKMRRIDPTCGAWVLSLVALWGASAGAQSPLEPGFVPEPDRSHWMIDSDATFVGYQVSSPSSPVRIERRRFVETLGLEYVRAFGELEAPRYRLRTHFSLRLDQEFGRDCTDERCLSFNDPDARRDHQVLADVTRLEVPALFVAVEGPRGLAVTAGRQLIVDDIGFLRLDGGRVGLRPSRLVAVEAFAGRQAVHTLGAGYGFEVPGSIRVGLPEGLVPERVPFAIPPTTIAAYGGRVELGDARFARGRLAFRELRDEGGLVARRLAAGLLSRPHPMVALRTSGVVDPTDGAILDAMGEVALTPWPDPPERSAPAVIRARVRHHEPRFDLGSIWAYFDVVPVTQLELQVDGSVGPVRLGGALRGRRSVVGQTTERDVGVEGSITLERRSWRSSLTGWLWAGDLAPASAVLLDVRRRLGVRGDVYARGSVWHFDDPWRAPVYATSVASAVGLDLRLTDQARVRGEVEVAYNRVVGARVRGLVSLRVRAWR